MQVGGTVPQMEVRTFSGHVTRQGQKKQVEATLEWTKRKENWSVTGTLLDKDGDEFAVEMHVSIAAPYRVTITLSKLRGNEVLHGEGFKEKDSFNVFGKLDVGQFSLKEDNSTSLRANVVQRLRTELIDMGFDSMMIDELIGKGQLNKTQLIEALTMGQSGEMDAIEGHSNADGPRSRLLSMGFDPDRVDEALLVTDGDENAALELLMA